MMGKRLHRHDTEQYITSVIQEECRLAEILLNALSREGLNQGNSELCSNLAHSQNTLPHEAEDYLAQRDWVRAGGENPDPTPAYLWECVQDTRKLIHAIDKTWGAR
jgi:hypothetical protein